MTCLTCKHWNLKDSPLRADGFGLCDVHPTAALKPANTFAGNTPCRFGRFLPAPAEVIARRAKEGAGPR